MIALLDDMKFLKFKGKYVHDLIALPITEIKVFSQWAGSQSLTPELKVEFRLPRRFQDIFLKMGMRQFEDLLRNPDPVVDVSEFQEIK